MTLLLIAQKATWANQTNVHWLGLLFTGLLAMGLLLLPRRSAPLTLLALACFIPDGQRIIVMTLDFTFLRTLVLVGAVRILVRREWVGFRVHPLDLTMLCWVAVTTTTFFLQHGTAAALILKLGNAFDAIGLYFLFRCFVRTWGDVNRISRSFSILVVPVCFAFLVEQVTGRNLFSIFGGVAEFTGLRDGRLRCQGPFMHPILAGCFWAAALPLIGARWWAGGRGRMGAIAGVLCCSTIIVLSASSTPIMTAGCAVLACAAFLVRRYMRAIRIATVLGTIGLNIVMKAPVWHLLARANVVGGSTGWHRFYLVDRTIANFSEWWLIGIASTAHWGRGLGDVTNQYVLEAVQGGLLGLTFFLALHYIAFRVVGRAWRSAWPQRLPVALTWALGASLFAQCVSFLGTPYFDQSRIIWFVVLACLGSLSAASRLTVNDAKKARQLRVRPDVPRGPAHGGACG